VKEFNDFLGDVINIIKERLGEEYTVNTEKILKNNECEFVSILIDRDDNDAKVGKVTPAIYMEQWYELYCDGCSIEDVVTEIIGVYEASLEDVKGFESINEDKENIASHIFFRIINAGNNKRLLEESPHVIFEDLAMTFHYMCSNDGKMLQSFRITNSLAESWKLKKQELYSYAMMNTPILFPEKFMSLKSIILKHNEEMVTFDEEVEYGIDNEIPMYVLTNETGFNGASAMLYSSYIKKMAEKFGCDIYILPSSIHEVILLPINKGMEVEELENLVKEVNENHVEPIERLSDNVYVYSRENDNIIMCRKQ